MGEIVDQMLRFGRAEDRRRVEGLRLDQEGRFIEGPFLGLTIPQAEEIEEEYLELCGIEVRNTDGKIKRHSTDAEDAARELIFYKLSEGKTLDQLFLMWAFASTKDYGVILLTPTFAQQEILAKISKAGREDVQLYLLDLKARQLGASTGIQILWYLLAATQGREKFLTIAHKKEVVAELFSVQETMHELMPFRPRVRFASSKGKSRWVRTGSTSFIESAEDTNPGRSRSYKFIHASEYAFWENAERIDGGLASTLPNRRFFVWIKESTANGVGNSFYDTWVGAENGENDWVAMFHAWWRHPEYELSDDEYDAASFDLDALPERMQEIRNYNSDIRPGQLAWYWRECMTEMGGDWDLMAQENPTWAGQAFRMSGSPVFDTASFERLIAEQRNTPLAPVFVGDIVMESPSASHLGGPAGHRSVWSAFPERFDHHENRAQ